MSNVLIRDVFGNKFYFKDDLYHREDGPAVEYVGGYKRWFLDGKEIDYKTNKEFLKFVKYKWLM